jgi:hypothetical protein
MKKRNSLIMGGLLALTLGLGVSGSAFAYQDEFLRKSPSFNQAFESQMTKVMTSQDYEAWQQLVLSETGSIDPAITKDNFPKFVEAWKLANEGNIKEANAIRRELGLNVA